MILSILLMLGVNNWLVYMANNVNDIKNYSLSMGCANKFASPKRFNTSHVLSFKVVSAW